jgi:membrane fusion protein, copper/silver efflux system
MKNYRLGFLLALVGNALLVGTFIGLWWHGTFSRPSMPKKSAETSAAQGAAVPAAAPAATAEAALTPVQLSAQRLQSIGVKFGTVEEKVVSDEVRTTGSVAVDETRLAYVQTRFPGFIEKVFVDATYQYAKKNQPLFTMYSPELVATEREYLAAKENQQQMAGSSVPGVASSAASLLEAAKGRLAQWGVPEREIARLDSTGQVQQEFEVVAPISGYITERNALPTVAVQPEMRLYTIADLSTVWVQAQVFQSDLGRIRIGDPATLTVDTFPGRAFQGRVNFIYPQVDMDTRSARVRVVFANSGMQLKPGMFVNVALQAPLGRQIVVPASAVLQSGTRQIVFVSRGDGYLEPREVQLGARTGDDFIVLKGLAAGEKVATSALFLVDSESELQAALGSFAPPPPGAGAAAAVNSPSANVELSSDPDPPHKGDNIFRVKLTDASGAPMAGAEVSVTFFMPAMPDMGMPAMRTAVTLSEKGAGIYEGKVRLENGGTWQVTIVARKNGQAIASRKLSVNSVGGM